MARTRSLEPVSSSDDGDSHQHDVTDDDHSATFPVRYSAKQEPTAEHDSTPVVDDRPKERLCISSSGPVPFIGDASRIRSRYLHRLGLDLNSDHRKSMVRRSPSPAHSHSHSACEDSVDKTIQEVVLKGDRNRVDRSLEANSSPVRPVKNGNKQSMIAFEPCVVIHSIPSRHCYSKRIRKTMWTIPAEFNQSITRNCIEFMAEGMDPSQVLEEIDFVERDGKLVHPICLILDEASNGRLREVYYGLQPAQPASV